MTASDDAEFEGTKAPPTKAQSARHEFILYNLLLAELAAQRKMPDVALSHFLEVARLTKSAKAGKEATEWAIEFQMPEQAQIAAELWAKTDPNDLQAQMVAATLLIGQSLDKAQPYLFRAIELNPKEIGQHIIAIQSRLSTKSAEHLKMVLNRIASSHPNDAYASLVAAQSAAQQEDIENANRWVENTLKLKPDLTAALELKARLIRYQDTSDANALKFLQENVNKFSYNAELRLFYANALMDANQFNEAVLNLKKISDDKKYGGQALLFLGEIYHKEANNKGSEEAWKKALSYDDSQDNARYLLGQLAETQGKKKDAVNWYTQIKSGNFHIAAQLRAAMLLKNNKQYDKAIQILHDSNATTIEEQKLLLLAEIDILVTSGQIQDALSLTDEILSKIPNDEDMLLAHSVVAAKLKQWNVAEKDLRLILKQNPDNTEALNTLGYILSLQKDRIQEAKQYLEAALALAPNNPSYLDSIGWYYFRTGDTKSAISYLSKANELSNDPEIAAHLGEALWIAGKRDEAKSIWIAGLKNNPDNEMLQQTVARYKVSVKPIKIVTKEQGQGEE